MGGGWGTTVWVAMRSRLWKCSEEQVRHASEEEERSMPVDVEAVAVGRVAEYLDVALPTHFPHNRFCCH